MACRQRRLRSGDIDIKNKDATGKETKSPGLQFSGSLLHWFFERVLAFFINLTEPSLHDKNRERGVGFERITWGKSLLLMALAKMFGQGVT